jgi:Zn-dependent protease with chaperone function
VSPLIIPIAIEWVILVTTLAPMILLGRFDSKPRLGLVVWFATLFSAGLAVALALGVALTSIATTYLKLKANPVGSESWLLALAASFAPWAILAISGISLALVNQRIAPIVSSAKDIGPLLAAATKPVRLFEGVEVRQIELPVMLAAAHRGSILISSTALATLTSAELEAVFWHEDGHIRGRHNQLKQLAGFVRALSPWLAASRALVVEVERLAELDADRYALRHVSEELLCATRSKFLSA